MEKSKAGTKKDVPGLSHLNQNTIIINIIWLYFIKKWKKYNEIQLTKNKMELNNLKMTNHPPYPESTEDNQLPLFIESIIKYLL